MQTVILAGGLGTRLAEETSVRPKPMVEIGDLPILVHIMEGYAQYGFKDFIVALGYKGDFIKKYFLDFHLVSSNISVDLSSGAIDYHNHSQRKDWRVRMIDTGKKTLTGGRLHRLKSELEDKGTFMLTYGDGVSDVNIEELVKFHKQHGKLMTMTVVRPPARFGTMVFDGNRIIEFKEKPQTSEGWINGGFFVCEPGVFEYLHGDDTVLEGDPLEKLASDGQLIAYKHKGFWKCMDTLRDRIQLNEIWETGRAPWKRGSN